MIGITTADRAPRRNYVGATLRGLFTSSPEVSPTQIHVFASTPDVRWFHEEVRAYGFSGAEAACVLHIPGRPLTRNENGLALLRAASRRGGQWLLHLEDDLIFCADFLGSVRRWLERHACERKVYTFCVFKGQPVGEAWNQPRGSYGTLAVAIRIPEVRSLTKWVEARIGGWRRHMRQPWRTTGFDMMVRAWAAEPFLAANPSFVQHAGDESLAHAFRRRPITRTPFFAGTDWRY